jgi:hypothetical protein
LDHSTDVKRQQGGADQGDLFDEAFQAALRHGANGEGGTGPVVNEEPQAFTAWDHERAPDGSGVRRGEPEPGLQAGKGERRRAGCRRDDRRSPARLDRRPSRRTDCEPAGRQLPTTTGAGCFNPQARRRGAASSAFPPWWTDWYSKRSRKFWTLFLTPRSRDRASGCGLAAAHMTRCVRQRGRWRTEATSLWTCR